MEDTEQVERRVEGRMELTGQVERQRMGGRPQVDRWSGIRWRGRQDRWEGAQCHTLLRQVSGGAL